MTPSGHDLLLSDAEELLNQHLMEVKQAELNRSYATLDFPPARNFIAVKDKIEASGVFKILEDMPKGGVEGSLSQSNIYGRGYVISPRFILLKLFM